MNPWMLCCLLLAGADQVPQRAALPDEFPPEIMPKAEEADPGTILSPEPTRMKAGEVEFLSLDPPSPSLLKATPPDQSDAP